MTIKRDTPQAQTVQEKTRCESLQNFDREFPEPQWTCAWGNFCSENSTLAASNMDSGNMLSVNYGA
jgi:hypothetical protein